MNDTYKGVMVLGEVRCGKIHSVTMELTGKAAELSEALGGVPVSVVLMCGSLCDSPEVLYGLGANRVIVVEHPSMDEFNQEVMTKAVVRVIESERPEIVLAPATSAGRTVLPAAAAHLKTGLTADCTGLDIDPETGGLLQTRPAIGGNVMATIKTPNHRPQMATVRPKTFRIPASQDRSGELVRPSLPDDTFTCRIKQLGVTRTPGDEGNIQDSDVVVSGGKGLRRPEGFNLIRQLARELDGVVGASRPTVEAKWIPYAHQVGLSGKVVAPKAYICAGVSGAVQHLAGMMTSGKIIAINKDPEAPIFRIADIAICGDLYDILPRLISRITAAKGDTK